VLFQQFKQEIRFLKRAHGMFVGTDVHFMRVPAWL